MLKKSMQNNLEYMNLAFKEAQLAYDKDEVPVGAVIVKNNQVIAQAHNLKEQNQNGLHHAELLALQKASQSLGSWRLTDCTLYVTLEPCIMCAGALVQSRISRLYYACSDPKGGGAESLYNIINDSRLNHQIECHSGLLSDRCSLILKDFFKLKRKKSKNMHHL